MEPSRGRSRPQDGRGGPLSRCGQLLRDGGGAGPVNDGTRPNAALIGSEVTWRRLPCARAFRTRPTPPQAAVRSWQGLAHNLLSAVTAAWTCALCCLAAGRMRWSAATSPCRAGLWGRTSPQGCAETSGDRQALGSPASSMGASAAGDKMAPIGRVKARVACGWSMLASGPRYRQCRSGRRRGEGQGDREWDGYSTAWRLETMPARCRKGSAVMTGGRGCTAGRSAPRSPASGDGWVPARADRVGTRCTPIPTAVSLEAPPTEVILPETRTLQHNAHPSRIRTSRAIDRRRRRTPGGASTETVWRNGRSPGVPDTPQTRHCARIGCACEHAHDSRGSGLGVAVDRLLAVPKAAWCPVAERGSASLPETHAC